MAFERLQWHRHIVRVVVQPDKPILTSRDQFACIEGVPCTAKHLIRVVILTEDCEVFASWEVSNFNDESRTRLTSHTEILWVNLVPSNAERLGLWDGSDV